MKRVIAALFLCLCIQSASATEFGAPFIELFPGLTDGIPAALPPAGLYGFVEPYTAQGNVIGPGAPAVNGYNPTLRTSGAALGLLYVPQAPQILGATYSFFVLQTAGEISTGNPFNTSELGIIDTFIAPIGLTWHVPNSNYFVQFLGGAYVPDGQIKGSTGLAGVAQPFFTFIPSLAVSYVDSRYDITARLVPEFYTSNYVTGYHQGPTIHVDLTATRKFGDFKLGPVAYVGAQVGNDRSSAVYNYAIASNRALIAGAGGLIGYDFGRVSVELWGLDEVYAKASGGTFIAGRSQASLFRPVSVFGRISTRLYGADPVAPPSLRARY